MFNNFNFREDTSICSTVSVSKSYHSESRKCPYIIAQDYNNYHKK